VTDLGVRLETLSDDPHGAPNVSLPAELEAAYGGPFTLPAEIVYGNFVTSIDGVAAIEGVETSSATISGAEPADRFVMALLRGVADAVVVGSGTLKEHRGPWTAGKAYPPVAGSIGEIRAASSAAASPTLVIVTGSGRLPTDHPAVAGAVVVTTASGGREIVERGVRCAEVIDVGEGDEVDARAAIAQLRDRSHRRILTEGGPSLMGSMLAAGVVEQLFLTISPKLLGGGAGRPPLTGETDLFGTTVGGTLLSVRRSGDYLFLRYELAPETRPAAS
jgi:riboflavin biosynthesis pyrimidine reductase